MEQIIQKSNEQVKYYPLNNSEKGFLLFERWFGKKYLDGRMAVIGTLYYADDKDFSPEAMEKAYFELLRRNDAFRMRLVKKNGKMKKVYQSVSDFPKPTRKIVHYTIEQYLNIFYHEDPPYFACKDEKLTMGEIICCEDGSGGLALWQHHICSDGYSQGNIVYRQLSEFYQCYKKGEEPLRPKKIFCYQDYCNFEQNQSKIKAILWWFKECNHHVRHYRVPSKVSLCHTTNDIEIIRMNPKETKEFDHFCNNIGYSDTSIILAAVSLVVKSNNNMKRFVMLTESHGRATYAQKNTSGAILKTLPIFADFVKEKSIKEYTKEINQKLLQASMHMWIEIYHLEIFCCFLMSVFGGVFTMNNFWFVLNNLRSYEEKDDLPLKMAVFDQRGLVTPTVLELNNEKDDFVLILKYVERFITKEKAKKLCKQLKAAIFYIMENYEKDVQECVEYLQMI